MNKKHLIVKLSMLLIFTLISLTLIACDDLTDGDYPVEENATEIKVWVRSFDDWSDILLESQVKQFNQDLTDGIQIVLKYYGDDNTYDTALAAGFENDNIADVFMAQYDRIYTYYRAGYITAVEDYLSSGIKEGYIDSVRESVEYLDTSTNSLKMYAMPWILEPSMMFYYRTDIFEKAGITKVPTTWEELLEACEKIKPHMDASKNQFTIGIPTTAVEFTWTTFGMLENVAGGQVVDDSWKVNRVTESHEGFKSIAHFWYDLAKSNYTPAASLTPEGYIDLVDAVADGKLAMCLTGSFGISRLMNYYPDLVDKGLFGVAEMPMPGGISENTITTCNGGWTYVLSSQVDDDKAAKAVKFMEWLLCDQEIASQYFDQAYYSKSATRTSLVEYIEQKTEELNIKDWIKVSNKAAKNGFMVQPLSWNVEYAMGTLYEYMINHAKEKPFDQLYKEKIRETIENINSIISQPGFAPNPKYTINE